MFFFWFSVYVFNEYYRLGVIFESFLVNKNKQKAKKLGQESRWTRRNKKFLHFWVFEPWGKSKQRKQADKEGNENGKSNVSWILQDSIHMAKNLKKIAQNLCTLLQARRVGRQFTKWDPRWVHNGCLLSWHYAPK